MTYYDPFKFTIILFYLVDVLVAFYTLMNIMFIEKIDKLVVIYLDTQHTCEKC